MRRITLGSVSGRGRAGKKIGVWAAVIAFAFGGMALAAGCSSSQSESLVGTESEPMTKEAFTVDEVEGDEWAQYLPEVVTKEDGTRVQKTPYAAMPNGYIFPEGWNLRNNYALNADNRGCISCHELEKVLMGTMDHWVYTGQYENEKIRLDDCYGCHDAYGVSQQNVQDYLHQHMNRESFKNMDGSCESCHYVTDEGDFTMWDEVKYDVLMGITDVSADEADVEVEWNQDEITPVDKMFLQKKAKNNWEWNLVEPANDIRDTYTVKFYGDMDNPREMTIQEMIDEFGLETRVIANQCTINGTGGPLIYQAEVTGIPMKKIVETLGLHSDANMLDAIGVEGYDIPVSTEVALDSDPLLVVEMNGEELVPSQGYPISIWFGDGISGGLFTRYLSEVKISHSDDPGGAYNNYNLGVFGDYVDPRSLQLLNTPNIGVLTVESGQIFEAGQPIHLEGYAHAFEEHIVKLEFSFDHGETWKEVPVSETDNSRWVYWKMDINNFTEPGSYLIKLRATSVDTSGEEHTNDKIQNCLINVE